MEGVGLDHPGGELLGRGVGHVHLAGVAHGLAVGGGDGGDVVLPGQGLEEAFAQDLVELVGVHAHRFQTHRGAPCLLVEVAQGLHDLLAAAGIGGGQVGDDHADLGQLVLADGDQEVRQGGGGDHGQVRIADGLGPRVLEVGRQFVEHDDQRVALQEVDPGGLTGGGQGGVVVGKLLLPAELGGDGTPDAVGDIALAPGEGDHPHGTDVPGDIEPLHHRAAVLRVLRQQPQGQEVVGLAAAHRLGELEDPLGTLALQAPKALRQEDAHALGDVVLAKKALGVDAVLHQVREVQDGIPAGLVEDGVAWSAGLGERFHGAPRCFRWFPVAPRLSHGRFHGLRFIV